MSLFEENERQNDLKDSNNKLELNELKSSLSSFMKESKFINTLSTWLLIPKNVNHVFGPKDFYFHLPKNDFVDERFNYVAFHPHKTGIFRKEGVTLEFELNPELFRNEMGPRALVDYSDEKIKEYAEKHVFTSEKELADFLVNNFYDKKYISTDDFYKLFEKQVLEYYKELLNCHAII